MASRCEPDQPTGHPWARRASAQRNRPVDGLAASRSCEPRKREAVSSMPRFRRASFAHSATSAHGLREPRANASSRQQSRAQPDTDGPSSTICIGQVAPRQILTMWLWDPAASSWSMPRTGRATSLSSMVAFARMGMTGLPRSSLSPLPRLISPLSWRRLTDQPYAASCAWPARICHRRRPPWVLSSWGACTSRRTWRACRIACLRSTSPMSGDISRVISAVPRVPAFRPRESAGRAAGQCRSDARERSSAPRLDREGHRRPGSHPALALSAGSSSWAWVSSSS